MKKTIVFFLLSICTLFVSAQSDTLKASKDTSNVTWTKVYGDAKNALNGLGAALKVGAEHVYEVMVKQQIVNSIVYLVIFIITCILVYFFFKMLKTKDLGEHFDDFDGICIGTMLLGTASLIFTVFTLVQLNEMITGFVNPEYGAIKEILEKIK